MKALQQGVIGDCNFGAEKTVRCHHERLKKVTKTIDTSMPRSYKEKIERSASPVKNIDERTQEVKERVAKDNLQLAKRIFKIMENPGMINNFINDTRHLDAHPGTMNFRHRLEIAQLIHKRNLEMANRLEKIAPVYGYKDLHMVNPLASKDKKKRKGPKISIVTGLAEALKRGKFDDVNDGAITFRSEGEIQKSTPMDGLYFNNIMSGSQSARKAESFSDYKFKNILLEYTKVQDDRILDVAVVKEPFRDRYIIYGIDASNGQRYEAQLTSEDVSNLLDGDMLVTSADNIEVWMAVILKITLTKVEAFSKFHQHADDQGNSDGNALFTTPAMPSSSRPTSRPGGRGGSKSKPRPRAVAAAPVSSKPTSTSPRAPANTKQVNSKQGNNKAAPTNAKKAAVEAPVTTAVDEEQARAIAKLQGGIRGKIARKRVESIKQTKKILQESKLGDESELEAHVVKLQGGFRMALAKKKVTQLKQQQLDLEEKHKAAVKLQGSFRINLAKRQVKSMKEEEKHKAAVKLQGSFRINLAKKQVKSMKEEAKSKVEAVPAVVPPVKAAVAVKSELPVAHPVTKQVSAAKSVENNAKKVPAAAPPAKNNTAAKRPVVGGNRAKHSNKPVVEKPTVTNVKPKSEVSTPIPDYDTKVAVESTPTRIPVSMESTPVRVEEPHPIHVVSEPVRVTTAEIRNETAREFVEQVTTSSTKSSPAAKLSPTAEPEKQADNASKDGEEYQDEVFEEEN